MQTTLFPFSLKAPCSVYSSPEVQFAIVISERPDTEQVMLPNQGNHSIEHSDSRVTMLPGHKQEGSLKGWPLAPKQCSVHCPVHYLSPRVDAIRDCTLGELEWFSSLEGQSQVPARSSSL